MPVPTDPVSTDTSLYECNGCQRRAAEPDTRRCECGGYLRNIGVPRPK